jgi:hypothetical protein
LLYRRSIGAFTLAAAPGVTTIGVTTAAAFDETKCPDLRGQLRRTTDSRGRCGGSSVELQAGMRTAATLLRRLIQPQTEWDVDDNGK